MVYKDIELDKKLGYGGVKTTPTKGVNGNGEERPLTKTQLLILDTFDAKRFISHFSDDLYSSIWHSKGKTANDLRLLFIRQINNGFDNVHKGTDNYKRLTKNNPTILKLPKERHDKK